MNNLPRIATTTALVLLSFLSVGYISCIKNPYDVEDPCMRMICYNGGTCTEGICTCMPGYAGQFCEIKKINPCDTIACQNGGTCIEGKCQCPTGYDGARCQDEARQKFMGVYKGSLNCPGATVNPELIVLPGNGLFKLIMKLDTSQLQAELIGDQTFNITEGNFNSIPITGTGYFDNTKVTIFISYNGAVQCTYKGER